MKTVTQKAAARTRKGENEGKPSTVPPAAPSTLPPPSGVRPTPWTDPGTDVRHALENLYTGAEFIYGEAVSQTSEARGRLHSLERELVNGICGVRRLETMRPPSPTHEHPCERALASAALTAIDELTDLHEDLGTLEIALQADTLDPEELCNIRGTLVRLSLRLSRSTEALNAARFAEVPS